MKLWNNHKDNLKQTSIIKIEENENNNSEGEADLAIHINISDLDLAWDDPNV